MKISLKTIMFVVLSSFLTFSSIYAYTSKEVSQLLNTKGVVIVRDKRVVTDVPARIQQTKDISSLSTGASYRLDRLPLVDRKTKNFIVSPQWGIVAPIVLPATGVDYTYLVKNNLFDYHPYLQQGVLWFPTTSPLGSKGNTVLFGHSSYWKSAFGEYHTIFMLLPLIERKEELWLYRSDGSGSYQRMIYTVSSSYKTSKDDVSVMNVLSNKRKYLTLVTCVPIGTAKERRIVRAISKE